MTPGLAIPMWLFDGLPEIHPEGGDTDGVCVVGSVVVVRPQGGPGVGSDRTGDRLGLT